MMKVLQESVPKWGAIPAFNAGSGSKIFASTTGRQSYVGGMPVGFINNGSNDIGLVCGGQAGECRSIITAGAGVSNFIGLLLNNYLLDVRHGSGDKNQTTFSWALPTIVLGPCIVELSAGTDQDVTDPTPPWRSADTFAIGDPLYIAFSTTAALNGLWTKTADNADSKGPTGAQKLGIVLKAPASNTDTMVAYFYGAPPANF